MSEQALPLAGATDDGEWILVSHEMTATIGMPPADAPMPPDPICLGFDLAARQPSLAVGGRDSALCLYIARGAWIRLGGGKATGRFHLAPELRAIALALRDCPMAPAARNAYRLAKSIELLCETLVRLRDGVLVPLAAEDGLSLADTRRLLAARRMVDERWREKLTLESIARACGLNREKLTRGFRALYGRSIGEALAERRLGQASAMLLTTDKPVSSIGYENGYLSNASFARAFSRRFGVSPSDYRSFGKAA
jgi:AraC family transcriptional activator of pyochelin receptor